MSHVDEGLLHAYLDGELTPVERARVDEHLAGCLTCRTRLEEERQLIERASILLSAALPPDRLAPPLSALARPRPRRFWHVRLPLAWAATVVLAVGLGWTLAVQMMPRHAPVTLGGPIAVRENQAPPAQQPAAPAPTASGRLDMRRQRSDKSAGPALAQKPAARPETALTDELRSVTAAEERGAVAAGSVATPAPAPVANLPTRNLEPRLQAATVEAAPTPLDAAAVRAILDREPLVIPGLPVLRVTRSPRTAHEIVVEQALDSTQVIVLFESRLTMVSQYLERDRAASSADTRSPAAAKAAPDSVPLRRFVDGVWIEIQGRLTADSLQKLLGQIKP